MLSGHQDSNSPTPERPSPPPARYYRIRVQGQLGSGWSEWFAGMTLAQMETGDTMLSGPVVDQAALHGLLAKIRDLNLTLVAVEQVEDVRGTGADLR
jgi:hypothetical protein